MQILNIHTRKMKSNGKLGPDFDVHEFAALTKNFSGAEIEGLVRAAQSCALNRLVKASSKVCQLFVSNRLVNQTIGTYITKHYQDVLTETFLLYWMNLFLNVRHSSFNVVVFLVRMRFHLFKIFLAQTVDNSRTDCITHDIDGREEPKIVLL